MNKNRFASLIIGASLTLAAVGCGESGNTNTANANRNANNNNTAVLNTNNGNGNNANATANNNSGARNYNANISREEFERDKDRYTREAKEAGQNIGTAANDGYLWVKTKGALASVNDLEDSNINVDVDNGVITLRGSLPTQAQVQAAVQAANGIEGKQSVKNELKVGGAGGNTGNSNGHGAGNTNQKH